MLPAFPVHVQPAILHICQEAHARSSDARDAAKIKSPVFDVNKLQGILLPILIELTI